MIKTIDAKGLACPQPVMLVLNEIKKTNDEEIVVLVDTATAKENVTRATKNKGWKTVELTQEDEGYRIILRKRL